MSSETSTDVQAVVPGRAGGRIDTDLQPWQLFTLAGLIGAAVVAFFASSQPPSVRIALILTVFAAAAIGLAVLRTLGPLAGPVISTRASQVLGGRTRAALEREKALALRTLKELEFDRAMGKISEKDYAELGGRLRARAARILRQLDAGPAYREAIEQEVARRVAERGGRTDGDSPRLREDGEAEHGDSPRLQRDGILETGTVPGTTERGTAPSGTVPVSRDDDAGDTGAVPLSCSTCDTANDADARFCKSCGARLGSQG